MACSRALLLGMAILLGAATAASALSAPSAALVRLRGPARAAAPPGGESHKSRLLRLRGGADAVAEAAPAAAAAAEANPKQAKVESALEDLRNKCADTGRANEDLVAAISLMLLYTENIAKNPTEAKFRKIKASNKAFASKIASLPGAAEILEDCGFEVAKEGDETFYVIPEAKASDLTGEIAGLKSALVYAQTIAADSLGQMVTSQTGAEEEPQFEEVYNLSCQMEGHAGDVRGLCVLDDGRVVTASRDKTLKIWARGKEGRAFAEAASLEGHEYHLSSLAVSQPSASHPEGLIFSGQYDCTSHGNVTIEPVIKVWEQGKCVRTLRGHTATVSVLAASDDGEKLYSGSWDHTVRVWDVESGTCLKTLKGHTQAVWALLPLPGDKLLSGSADRSIQLWDTHAGTNMGSLHGHGDAVRALAMIKNGVFVSAGNDCSIKFWSLDLAGNSLDQSIGFCLQTLSGHDSFIYALSVRENGDVVTGSEDRTVKIWRDGKLVSSVRLPDGVWSVATLDNGDIVAGCADGVTRIFTQSDERNAPEEEAKAYTTLCQSKAIELRTLGGLQIDKLPGPEALEKPGTNDGQTRVIRQGDKAFAYGWSNANVKWEPLGEVVDGPGQNSQNTMGTGKSTLDGVEYDYVFQIEVEEGGKVKKIGMNRGDNTYMVASDFIDKYDLNPDYLEIIAKWLDAEVEKIDPKPTNNDPSLLDRDPFNEGKVYRAGSASKLSEKEQVFYDPLTGKKLGGGACDDSDDEDAPPKKSAAPIKHVPSTLPFPSFLGHPKPEGVLKKLGEFNAAVPQAVRLTDAEMEQVGGLMKHLEASEKPSAEQVAIMNGKLLAWPRSKLFPALDVMRDLICNNEFATQTAGQAMGAYSMAYAKGAPDPEELTKAQAQDVILKIVMAACIQGVPEADAPTAPTVLMSMRALCNAFAHKELSAILQIHTGTVAAVYSQGAGVHATNKMIQAAYGSVILCYGKALHGLPIDDFALDNFLVGATHILKALTEDSDPAGIYRTIAGIGTILHGNNTRIMHAQKHKIETLVRDRVMGLELVKGGDKSSGDVRVQQCCYQLLELFDVVRLIMEPGIKHPDTDEEFNSLLTMAGNKPVIVDFYADWCGPCKVIAPVFESLANDNPDAIFVKVDVDQLKGTSQKCGVSAMPTFQFFVGGKKMHQIQGANEAGLRAAVDALKQK